MSFSHDTLPIFPEATLSTPKVVQLILGWFLSSCCLGRPVSPNILNSPKNEGYSQ